MNKIPSMLTTSRVKKILQCIFKPPRTFFYFRAIWYAMRKTFNFGYKKEWRIFLTLLKFFFNWRLSNFKEVSRCLFLISSLLIWYLSLKMRKNMFFICKLPTFFYYLIFYKKYIELLNLLPIKVLFYFLNC